MESKFYRKLVYDVNADPEDIKHITDILTIFLYMLIVIIAVLYMVSRNM